MDLRVTEVQKKTKLSLELWKKHQDNVTKNVLPAVTDRVKNTKEKDERLFNGNRRVISKDAFPRGAKVMMRDVTKESK